ncbi:hypothetical protein JTE90_002719 [Oedothorax gibbosus]|uniref:Uncharacterized protein n=1 Tax=Oedothorax gibbosus TaxID=931172 RepID=A0AAV6VWA0_9ARAC|nr:hypothetical protein JTE90_002719 [Oedothorax gibbosus]
MKVWDIDSPESRNLNFRNVRNFIKPSTSATVATPKTDTKSQSTEANGSVNSTQHTGPHPEANGSANSTQHTGPHPFPKKQRQPPKIQNSVSTATGTNISKSVSTYDQKNDISSVKHNGKLLNGGAEKLPINIDIDANSSSKNCHDIHSNEFDSFNTINNDSEMASEKDDIRYSLYYDPSDKSLSDDGKGDTLTNENSYSDEIEHFAKDLNFSKVVNYNGYQRTRKNMKKNLTEQKNVSMNVTPKVKMTNSGRPLSKGNVVSKKQISTGNLSLSEEVARNGFQCYRKNFKKFNLNKQNKLKSDSESDALEEMRPNPKKRKESKGVTSNGFKHSRKNLKSHNLVKQNRLYSDTESDSSGVMMHDSKKTKKMKGVTSNDFKHSSKNLKRRNFNIIESSDSETSKVLIPTNPNESFDNVCVAGKERSTQDISTTVSTVRITNIDSKGASTVLKREASNCNRPTKRKKKSLHLVEKKMPNRSDSKCDLTEITVPYCNSTSNNAVMVNQISSSGEKLQTEKDVSIEILKKFTESKKNQSCLSDIHESSLHEKNILSSYSEDNCQSSEESEKSYHDYQKSEKNDGLSCDSKDDPLTNGMSSHTENIKSNNSLSKDNEDKTQYREHTKLGFSGKMKAMYDYKGTSEPIIQTAIAQPSSSASSIVSPTFLHPNYKPNSSFSSVTSIQSLNNSPTDDSCAPKMVLADSNLKMVNLSLVYPASSEEDSNPFIPVLTSQVNKLSATILKMGMRDCKILPSIPTEQLNRFYDYADWLGRLSEMEIACELCLNPPDSEEDDHSQNDLYERCMEKALNSPEQCASSMLETLIYNIDATDLLFKVRQFCTSPKVVLFTERLFASFREFPLSSLGEVKVQFRFPEDFENQPLNAVVKDYVRFLAHKIWPKEAKTITSQYVIEFAQQNLSTVEIFIVSNFFRESELLTKQSFISRLTYVATFSVYKFYTRMVDE